MRIRHQLWSIKIAMPSGYHEGTAGIRPVEGFDAVPSSAQCFFQSLCLNQLLEIRGEVRSGCGFDILEYTHHGNSHFIRGIFTQKNGLGRHIWVGWISGGIVETRLGVNG